MPANDHLKQLMVDNLKDCALVLLDTDGRVLSWNAGATNLLGYEEAQAVGRAYGSILPPESCDCDGAPLSLAIARKKGRHEEICQRTHRNGARRALREVVISLRDSRRNLVAFGLMMQSLEAALQSGPRAGRGSAIGESTSLPKVLVVDDDDQVRMTAEATLKDLDYEVLAVASGAEALDILRRDDSIDVLFTDVVMPGMDGGELAEQARLLRPDLRVLFTSGYFAHALIRRGNITPNTNLLVKPYRPRDLARKMKVILADDVPGDGDRPEAGHG